MVHGSAADAHSVVSVIQPAIILLGLGILAALGAKICRLNPIVGYIAVSLALTPAISTLGRKLAGKLRQGPPDQKLAGDDAPILTLNLAETGCRVADILEEEEVSYMAIESNRERFETALAEGYPVHFAPVGDPRSWQAIGVAKRLAVVVTLGNMDRVREISPLIRDHAPDLMRIIAVDGMEEPPDLDDDMAVMVDVSDADGADHLADEVLEMLGIERRMKPSDPSLDSVAA